MLEPGEAALRRKIATELEAAADAYDRRIAEIAGVPYRSGRADSMVAHGIRRAAQLVLNPTDPNAAVPDAQVVRDAMVRIREASGG
jgi:hypothetical protein